MLWVGGRGPYKTSSLLYFYLCASYSCCSSFKEKKLYYTTVKHTEIKQTFPVKTAKTARLSSCAHKLPLMPIKTFHIMSAWNVCSNYNSVLKYQRAQWSWSDDHDNRHQTVEVVQESSEQTTTQHWSWNQQSGVRINTLFLKILYHLSVYIYYLL